jgi:hypothetical protein
LTHTAQQKRRTWLARLTILLVAALTHAAWAGSPGLTLTSVRDNTLYESDTGALSNGAGPAIFAGDNSSLNTRRGLLYFDVAGHLPAGVTILNAELRLHVSSVPVIASRMVNVHRVLADWGEGDSYSSGGAGAPAESGDATWVHRFHPDSLWSSVGGDFIVSASAGTAVPDTGSYIWSSPELVADVQSWIDHPASEFGWILLGEEGIPQTARKVDSREAVGPALAPVLWIEIAPVPVQAVSWGKLKLFYR